MTGATTVAFDFSAGPPIATVSALAVISSVFSRAESCFDSVRFALCCSRSQAKADP